MLKLLNTVSWFGINLNWDSDITKICLVAAQALIALIFVIFIIYLIKRKSKKKAAEEVVVAKAQPVMQTNTEVVHVQETKPTEIRTLKGVTLDLGVVQREFVLDEGFNCAGLVVNAEYNLEPKTESIVEYRTVDVDFYNRLGSDEKENTCYVIKPDMSQVGKKVVYVRYGKHAAAYTVDVHEAVEQVTLEPASQVVGERVIVEEESVEAGRLRYDKSFEARLIQSEDEIKHWYTEVKNELLSYKTARSRISWKRETFKAGKQVVAMLVYRGKTLCLFLPLKLSDYGEEYRLEDASGTPTYEDIPAMLRIKNEKRVRIAIKLIQDVMDSINIIRKPNYVSEDFYVPYEGIVELINKGLVKREIKSSADEAIFERDKVDDDE